MPEIIACPDCGRKLRVPDDLLGRKVKCPGCGINFTASVVSAPPPVPQNVGTEPRSSRRLSERYDDDEPPRRRPVDDDYDDDRAGAARSPRESWKKVRLGLTWVIISIWVYLGAVGIQFIGMLFLGGMAFDSITSMNINAAAATGGGIIALGLFVSVAFLVAQAFKVTGFGFGLAIPPKRNSAVRGLGIATFILGACDAALMLVIMIVTMVNNMSALAGSTGFTAMMSGGAMGPLLLLEVLVWAASAIVFLFYLRSMCLVIRKDGMASTVTTFLISVGALGLVTVLLWVFIFGIAVIGSGSPQGVRTAGAMAMLGCGLMGLAFLAALGLFIWFIVILHQVRGVVDSYIRNKL